MSVQLVFQEIPDQISISFLISGCQLRCKGCHSADSWNPKAGNLLTEKIYKDILINKIGLATCVLFLGGEWYEVELIKYLKMAHQFGYKTALYTGLTQVSKKLMENLDYIKIGPYIQELGGLDSPNTNQKLIKIINK